MLIASLALMSAAVSADDAPREMPEVWMCHHEMWQLAEREAEWDFVREHLAGVKLYIGSVLKGPEDEMAALARTLRDAGIKVSIECGGTLGFAPLDDTNGEKSAEIELAKIKRWTDAGGELHYLELDGPVRRLLHPGRDRQGFTSIERCVNELMDYMRAVRAVYPDIEFFAITNFPNWGYRGEFSYHARGPKRQDWGEYEDVIAEIIRQCRENEMPLKGLTCDNPYEYAIGEKRSATQEDPTIIDWIARVRELEKYVEGEGLEFNLICNSEAGGRESAQAFYERSLKFLDTYLEAGGTPKRYLIQSWYPHPEDVLPETGGHSMTALVKAFIERLGRP